MWFLMNNPLVLVIGLVIIALAIYTVIQIKNEVSINRLLKNKQYAMRISVPEKVRFSSKIKILTTATITPIIVIVFVLAISIGNTTDGDLGNIATFNRASDIEGLYSDFASNIDTYSEPASDRIEDSIAMEADSPLDYVEVPIYSADDLVLENDVEAKSYGVIVGNDDLSTVITDDTHTYSISDNDVVVTITSTESLEVDVLELTTRLPQSDFTVSGLYVDDTHLLVVSSDCSYVNCSGVSVLVYDKNKDFELIDIYQLSGRIIGLKKIDDTLVVITNDTIPFENVDFNLNDYLPTYDNGTTVKAVYEDIIYSDGTYPNSFTSIFGIDLETSEIDMEVILGDSEYDVYITEDGITLTGNAYVFDSFSSIVDLEHPVSGVKTALIKFEISGNNIDYITTTIIDDIQ